MAPPVTTSDDADIEPPTGIPWNTPATTLPAPCPTKSLDASVADPSGFGNPAEIPAPCTRPTNANDTAGTSTKTTSPSSGNVGAGNPLGSSARSRTSAMPRSKLLNSAARAEPIAMAATIPNAPSRVCCSDTINTTVTMPTISVAMCMRFMWNNRSTARMTRFDP